jgi:hypothetical protein
MSDNPYQSPQTEISAERADSAGTLTVAMVSYLKDAAPWIRFIGILGYIGCGFMLVGGIGILSAIPFFAGQIPEGWGAGAVAGFCIIYIVIAALMFFPSRFTYKFGSGIRNFLRSNSGRELELAFKNNRSLWKFLGIMAIVNLAIVPVMLVIGIISAVFLVFA